MADGTANAGLPERTISLVVGALGGEGGGVLTSWIVGAAEKMDFPVQSTSIPGVAQRTGATTYYIEIYPATHEQTGGRRPVMGLYSQPGHMDVVISSEIMEAGRMIENGMVTPDRTTLIASTHRVYSITEKSAMGNGLYDTTGVRNAAEKIAQRSILFDMERLAEAEGTVLNAIVLGVLAGSGTVPIPADKFEQSIRDGGVAVDSNLRGFRAGLAYMKGEKDLPAEIAAEGSRWARAQKIDDLVTAVESAFPAETHSILTEGVRRLVDYQNPAYARTFLDRMVPVLEADRAHGGTERGFELTREAGRYLALWMSYEDIIRVADLKSRVERWDRVRNEVGAKTSEPMVVTEFLKPGYEEISSVMPPGMGRALINWAQKSEKRRNFHFAMRVKTNTFFGYFRLWALARMKWWRPKTFRFSEENAEIVRWLEVIANAPARSYELALEIAELPNLRKGYSDTSRRGIGNFRRIFDELAVQAVASGDGAAGAEAVRKVRTAALADPEGDALDTAMAEVANANAPQPVQSAAE